MPFVTALAPNHLNLQCGLLSMDMPMRDVSGPTRLLKLTCVVLYAAILAGSSGFAQRTPAPTPRQQPGGPNSGPAPAPPQLTGDALQHSDVPAGRISGPLTLRSRIYDGMLSNYWVYAPAQYDPHKPA